MREAQLPVVHLPSTQRQQQRQQQNKYKWRSCCWDLDKRCLLFSTKVMFSAIILFFALYQIAYDSNGCSNNLLSWYCSLVGVILGSFVNIGKAEKTAEIRTDISV